MLRRLLAYDFRSMWKQFSILWPAVLLVALLNKLLLLTAEHIELPDFLENSLSLFFGLVPTLVYFALMVALFVISLIYVLQRFYNGLLGSEGYLMHTLPVKPWHLIASKLITAVVTTVCSSLVGFLSILILAADEDSFHYTLDLPSEFGTGDFILLIFQFLLLGLLALCSTYTHIYAACSLGQLSSKNRLLLSVVAYVAINIVLSTLSSTALMILGLLESNGGLISNLLGDLVWDIMSDRVVVSGAVHLVMLAANLLFLLRCALFFFVTEFLLRKKLNLQ